MSTTDLFSQALSLPLSQRAELAHQLIDSLQYSDPPPGPSDEEIENRLSAIASGRFDATDWRQSMAQLRAALANYHAQAE